MNRIGARISSRINTTVSQVKCPGCSKRVVPTIIPDVEPESNTSADGKRWSFIWRPPRGEICPECQFPLARFAYRKKWVSTLMAGIVVLTLAVLLLLLAMMSGFPSWFVVIVQLTAAAGIATVVIGFAGLIVGGRHGSEMPTAPPS